MEILTDDGEILEILCDLNRRYMTALTSNIEKTNINPDLFYEMIWQKIWPQYCQALLDPSLFSRQKENMIKEEIDGFNKKFQSIVKYEKENGITTFTDELTDIKNKLIKNKKYSNLINW